MNARNVAQEVMAKVRPGPLHARRSLPIRGEADEIARRWTDPSILQDIPVESASVEVGEPMRDRGTVTTVSLTLEAAVSGIAANALAGTAVRRLKALAETGEVPRR
jgi:hypothetical protein